MNITLIEVLLKEKGISKKELARQLNLTEQAVGQKFNKDKNTNFSIKEAETIKELLELTPEQAGVLFFGDVVRNFLQV